MSSNEKVIAIKAVIPILWWLNPALLNLLPSSSVNIDDLKLTG